MMTTENVTTQSQEAVQQMQERKLVELLDYISVHSPFYKKHFKKYNIDTGTIRRLTDLVKIPAIGKEDLQKQNEDFLCVPKDKIIEYSSTSGTLGSPVTIALTESDLTRLAQNEFHSFECMGAKSTDIFQLMLTLDRQFMAGMAYYSGLRKIGAGIIRLGPGVPSLQLETIQRLSPTAIIAVPSFIVKLIDFAKEHNIDLNRTSVKKALCIGENIRNIDFSLNVLGKKITDAWNIELYSTYASTEMQTAFTECSAFQGGHMQPELIILELLDENDQQVRPGDPGEVTITTLGVEGMPLLRYKTGDLCIHHEEKCSCGRITTRLSPVVGRKKQMIKFKGTTLYPPALFDMLNEMEDVKDYVAEVYSNEMGTDEVLLHILPANLLEETDRKIRANLQARLRVSPHVNYVTQEAIQKMQLPEAGRKLLRFIDNRR
jgi:phenylacetate-CoA ligase